MESRAYALLTGLFLALLIAALAVLAVWLRDDSSAQRPYLVVSEHPIPGLQVNSTVTYRGVRAGQVDDIRLDPEHPNKAFIDIRVREDIPMTQGMHASLRYQGITGLTQIDLANASADAEPLETSADDPARLPMKPSPLEALTSGGGELMSSTQTLLQRLNALLDESNRERFSATLANLETLSAKMAQVDVDRLNRTLANLETLSGNMAELETGKLNDAMVELPGVLRRAEQTLARADRALGGDLVPRLVRTLEQLNRTARDIGDLARGLERDPQQLLLGPRERTPGPGEPGYQEGNR